MNCSPITNGRSNPFATSHNKSVSTSLVNVIESNLVTTARCFCPLFIASKFVCNALEDFDFDSNFRLLLVFEVFALEMLFRDDVLPNNFFRNMVDT